MKNKIYFVRQELKGAPYNKLLEFAVAVGGYALLVFNSTKNLNIQGQMVLERLDPYLSEKKMQSQWPGTILLDSKELVFKYAICREFIDELKKAAKGVYSWLQPDLPEDLCLMRVDKTPWFYSVAHEAESYLELSDDELALLTKSIPEIDEQLEEIYPR